jgi:hypothetical protein
MDRQATRRKPDDVRWVAKGGDGDGRDQREKRREEKEGANQEPGKVRPAEGKREPPPQDPDPPTTGGG